MIVTQPDNEADSQRPDDVHDESPEGSRAAEYLDGDLLKTIAGKGAERAGNTDQGYSFQVRSSAR